MAQGRLRRLVTRRRAKWAGLVLCVLIGAVFVSARWMYVSARTRSIAGVQWWASIGAGRFGAGETRIPNGVTAQLYPSSRYAIYGDPRLNLWFDWEKWRLRNGLKVRHFLFPLWMPLLLFAVPTVWLWHTDRRAKPWQCPKCRYDLRGLDGGVCPECGTGVEAEL